MDKELCLVQANCQGEPLAELLSLHPEFSACYRIESFVNYTREAVPSRALKDCRLFLYQWLDAKWGELASENLLAGLSEGARAVCVPNLFFKAYWPFWESNKVMDYSDMLLNQFIDRGLSKAEVLHLYLHTDIRKYYDLDKLIARSLEREREKEKRWDIKAADLVLELYRDELLFNTVNHPCRRLCLHVADGVLELLGLAPLSAEAGAAFRDPFPEFMQPMHPQVIDYLGLNFVGPEIRYFVYGAYKTFEEYVDCYVDCRMLGINDFIGYLRLDCGRRDTPWQP